MRWNIKKTAACRNPSMKIESQVKFIDHLDKRQETEMHTILSHGWSFALTTHEHTLEDIRSDQWRPVDLPHDWLISDTHALYRDGDGWYRRTLCFSRETLSGHVFLSFDGVYMDADILLNGRLLLTEHYGYAPFIVDLTPFALEGENELVVHVRYYSPNSRWYSGAGIFRDVELLTLPEACIVPDSIYAQPVSEADHTWSLAVSADLLGTSDGCSASFTLLDQDTPVASGLARAENGSIAIRLPCPGVRTWSPASPHCYTLKCSLGDQEETVTIGFRTLCADPERGFLLNDQPVKLHGVCLHHDLGCLGAAFHEEAAERQLTRLMQTGVNAIRTSHNPPARRFLDICDRLGLLVMDEAFDMWELSKTRYDYARFFSAHVAGDLTRMVRRDRNHPCVVFWSIGNEIQDTHVSPKAPRMTRFLRDVVRSSDPSGHALITMGSNYMPWEGAQKCADVLKLAGYNYAEKLYDQHHREHPDWVIFGSETASILSSRGIYHFPMKQQILCDEDEQCSALGNSSTSWGHQDLTKMLADDLNNPYSMGQFVWSGTDYIGEPTPYQTRSCYFGFFDTACFPKDSAWQYQAAWTEAPFVHIGVSWSWNPGQMIDIPVMTNLPRAELFLGEQSLGVTEVDVRDSDKGLAVWHVPYAPQPLSVRAWDPKSGQCAEDCRFPFSDSASLQITREDAPAGSLAFLRVTALDPLGHPVENAVDLVCAETDGPIRILGMDNGDSTDRDGYQTESKRLFSGKLLIVLQALDNHGTGRIRLSAQGLAGASCELPLNDLFHGEPQDGCIPYEPVADTRMYARAICLTPSGSTSLTPEHPSVTFDVRVFPEAAFPQEIAWRITNAAGIDSPCARVEADASRVTVTGCGDGDLYLRATVSNGDVHPRVISQYDLHLSGFGSPCLDPYGFISGGLYDVHEGEITSGNDHGFAFARDGVSMAGFTNVDFGASGSDRLTIPVFALDNDKHEIDLYTGIPGKGGVRIATLPYNKPSIWNVYQAETWTLPQVLTGIHTLCLVSSSKLHIKGFSFEKQSRAWRCLNGSEADTVWGDEFHVEGGEIRDIGNNVNVRFSNLDFGDCTSVALVLTGSTPLDIQPITVHISTSGGDESTSLLSFTGSPVSVSRRFALSVPGGLCDISFVFLPGSHFTFTSMQFIQNGSDDCNA